MNLRAFLQALAGDRRGSMTIEMAAVVPVLVVLSVGTFEVSAMVSRQQELQSAASEGETIALAAAMSDEATSLDDVEDIIETSMNLSDDQVTISQFYRCNDDDALVASDTSCDADAVVTKYMKLELTDHYEPVWTQFGVGSAFDYDVERMVQL